MTQSLRTSGSDLPSAKELLRILNSESPRLAVHYDYLANNRIIFDALRQLGDSAHTDTGWADDYPDLPLEILIAHINESVETLHQFIQTDSNLSRLYQRIYKNLIPHEDESASDLIVVFGAKSNARIERAVELYQAGIAPKMLLSGNQPFYGNGTEPEAVRMAHIARANGVPESALILEDQSITIPDNVKRSIDLLEQLQWRPSSITIVATNFVLRRAFMDWYKFTPWDISIKPVAARPQSSAFTSDGWYKDPGTIRLVLNEYAKLVLESKMDLIRQKAEKVQ